MKVFCLLKKPEKQKLISDENRSSGGTWHFHQIFTVAPTEIVFVGASQKPPVFDGNGIPSLVDPAGVPDHALPATSDHRIELLPLAPGNHYFFLMLVADSVGNWDFKIEEFDTLRRRVTVKFATLHVYNDGDPGGGEGEFLFKVVSGDPGPGGRRSLLEEFTTGRMGIDDWSETDRPYPLGFVHTGVLTRIDPPGSGAVGVVAHAVEHDGVLEPDEWATNFGVALPIPAGAAFETITNHTFLVDCPSTTDDDFHYGVDVTWSVAYAV